MEKSGKLCIYLTFYLIFFTWDTGYSQNLPVKEYIDKSSNYGILFRGMVEQNYNPYIYANQPYYISSDFSTGDIYYKKRKYPAQKMRLDFFKDQLIILSPDNYNLIVGHQGVDSFYIHNKLFVYYIPEKKIELKDGYYLLLHQGEKIKILAKGTANLNTPKTELAHFSTTIRYYGIYNTKSYTIRNRTSFSKIFPQYKKDINRFAKTRKLKFKEDIDKDIASMAAYCEELLNNQIDGR